jgi:hypothetical protein
MKLKNQNQKGHCNRYQRFVVQTVAEQLCTLLLPNNQPADATSTQ